MQALQLRGNVGKVRVEYGVALGLPPEPILNDRVQGNMILAVTIGNVENFALRNIPVLGLKQSIGPLWPVSYTHLDVYKRQP